MSTSREQPKIGDAVVYHNERGVGHNALITANMTKKFQCKMDDHGLGGSLYCYAGGQKVAEAHGSGGSYTVRIFNNGATVFNDNIYDNNDDIQKVIEQFLLTGRWPAGLNRDQDDGDALATHIDIVSDFIGEAQ